jgi:hypothetical protein
MNTKTEGLLAIFATLLVLFATMLGPRISAGLAIVCLLGYGIYKFMPSRPKASQ